MERISLPIEADIRVNGEQQIQQLSDSIRMSADEMKRFQELGEWTNAREQIQNIEAMKNSIAQLTQAQKERPNDYSTRARQIFEAEQTKGNQRAGFQDISTMSREYKTQEIQRLNEKISQLDSTLNDIKDKLDEAKERNDTQSMAQLSNASLSTEQEKNALEKKLNSLLAEDKNSAGAGSGGIGKYFGLKELGQVFKFVGDIAQIGNTYRQSIANGDYIGAEINKNRAYGSTAGSAISSIGTILMAIPGMQIPGAIALSGGSGLKGLSDLIASGKEADAAYANAYENTLKSTHGFNSFFGYNDPTELLTKANKAAKDTGIDSAQIIESAKSLAAYGIKGTDTVLEMTGKAAKWSNFTGVDIDRSLRAEGVFSRYGDVGNVLGTVYGGLQKSGMERGQYGEFLDAMLQVMEDGISNGFTQSSSEVAQNLSMFARLSDNNPLWQGQQGAQRFMQMNNSIAGATDLKSTDDMIVASALRVPGESYIDTMLRMEEGLNGKNGYKNFQKITQAVQQMEGGNYEAQIERYKNIFGVNYHGAKDIYEMARKVGTNGYTEEQFKIDADKVMKNPQNNSDLTRLVNLEDEIKTYVSGIGQEYFNEQFTTLENTLKEQKGEALQTNDTLYKEALVSSGTMAQVVDSYIGAANPDSPYKGIYARLARGEEDTSPKQLSIVRNGKVEDLKPKGFGDVNFLKYLVSSDEGNNDFDEKIKEKAGVYATSIQKGYGSSMTDNEKLDKALQKISESTEVFAAYMKGNAKDFEMALEKVLSKTNITVNAVN